MENLLSLSYPKPNGTSDGHGGRGIEHRAEMQAIATQITEQRIKELVPEMARDIYRQSLEDMLRGIEYDVATTVNIGMENGQTIFNSKKAQKAISDAIYREIVKGLGSGKKIKLKL